LLTLPLCANPVPGSLAGMLSDNIAEMAHWR